MLHARVQESHTANLQTRKHWKTGFWFVFWVTHHLALPMEQSPKGIIKRGRNKEVHKVVLPAPLYQRGNYHEANEGHLSVFCV